MYAYVVYIVVIVILCKPLKFSHVLTVVSVGCVSTKTVWMERDLDLWVWRHTCLSLLASLRPLNFWLDFPSTYVQWLARIDSKTKMELMDWAWLFNWFSCHVSFLCYVHTYYYQLYNYLKTACANSVFLYPNLIVENYIQISDFCDFLDLVNEILFTTDVIVCWFVRFSSCNLIEGYRFTKFHFGKFFSCPICNFPCRYGLEYSDCLLLWDKTTPEKKVRSRYYTKVYLIVRLQSERYGEYGVPHSLP